MNNFKKICPFVLAALGIIGNANAANGLNFNFSYAPDTDLEQIVAFETVGEVWSNYLIDDVTVNIYVEFTDSLPENVIGGALPGWQSNKNYSSFMSRLGDDRTSNDDYTAYDRLAITNNNSYRAYLEHDLWTNNKIALTNANAKSLGLMSSQSSNHLDGYILINDLSDYSTNWHYGMDAPDDSSLDFFTVATHEIGHILGFVSSVDSVENEDYNSSFQENQDRLDLTTPLDRFRYTDYSSDDNAIDLAYGSDSYFSIDGGQTNLGYFSEGEDLLLGFGGDGYQTSHWKCDSSNLGIMCPALSVGERKDVSSLDSIAFDVIGYDVDYSAILDWNNISQNVTNNAANAVVGDRTKDVEKMIRKSKIYQGRRRRWNQTGLFWQEAYFNSFSWQTIDLAANSQSVPEPASAIGLLGMGLFGFSKLKRKNKI